MEQIIEAAPSIVFDDPYYGIISTVSVKTQTNAAYTDISNIYRYYTEIYIWN